MCGIVAATSHRNVSIDLFEMLRMLDYRGYDSAGISIVNENGQFEFHKKQGNLDRLANALDMTPLNGCAGVGHTRWATHGAQAIQTPIHTSRKRAAQPSCTTELSKITGNYMLS